MTDSLIHQILDKKRQLDARRPLSAATIKRLDDWYDAELTYTSNAIEGNTLTRSETAIVLEKGITVRGKPLRDHLEVIDHRDALQYVRTLAQQKVPLRESTVRELHQLVLGRSDTEEAGRYSTGPRMIKGSKVTFPNPSEIAPLMQEFGEWLQRAEDATHKPDYAFEAHARLVSIHPFSDGNGRTSRLLMNLMLFKDGYPPVVIADEHRPDYVDALEHRHLTGDGKAFHTLMCERLLESIDNYIKTLDIALQSKNELPSP